VHTTGWSRDLSVDIAGRDVINHAGAAALRLVTDRTGLTAGLSRALARRDFLPVHDRGRVLADTAVLIADGGRVLSDLATLREQGELYGPIASDPTLWRALDEIGEPQRRKIARARAKTREHVWSLIAQRHGRIPPSRVADRDLGKTIVVRVDASLVISHSDKELAAGTYKGSFGHHPLMAWCDNTGESLSLLLRTGSAGSNTVAGAPRGASSYPQHSWEELGGRFLGLMAYLDPKGEGDNSMPGKQRSCSGVETRRCGTRVIWLKLDCLNPNLQMMQGVIRRKDARNRRHALCQIIGWVRHNLQSVERYPMRVFKEISGEPKSRYYV
jgi:DDE family transposase